MSKLGIAALCVAALTLQGCGALGRTARIDPAAVATIIDFEPAARSAPGCPIVQGLGGDRQLVIDLSCFRFPSTYGGGPTAYTLARSNPTARNRLEEVLLNHANVICQDERGRIYAQRALANGVLDLLAGGLSTASTIVGGDQAKSILSGLAGFSTATRTNVEANIYQNQLVPAITKAMDAERDKILKAMLAKRREGVDSYNVDEMIRMANQYHQACSFERGVQLLVDAGANNEGYEAIVRDINLRSATQTLRREIDAAKLRGADDTATAFEDEYQKLVLRQINNTVDAGAATPNAAGGVGEEAAEEAEAE